MGIWNSATRMKQVPGVVEPKLKIVGADGFLDVTISVQTNGAGELEAAVDEGMKLVKQGRLVIYRFSGFEDFANKSDAVAILVRELYGLGAGIRIDGKRYDSDQAIPLNPSIVAAYRK